MAAVETAARAMPRRYPKPRADGFRSAFEADIAAALTDAGVDYQYENLRVCYHTRSRPAIYKPDFRLPNGVIVEAKGEFNAADREKHLLVRLENPDLDIRFVFQRPHRKLTKAKAGMTYAQWCDKNGFMWADKTIPKEWYLE